jgi:DNA processing protein
LCLTRGIAARLSARLLKQFGSPEHVFRVSLRHLEGCQLPAATAQAILKKEAFKRAEKELAAIRGIPGCQLVNRSEPGCPQTLLQIYDPPVLLYVRGDAQILNAPSLAVVGTRRPTLYGTQMADRLARDLAARGIVIVSGLARGIDAIAHQGTMTANGRAIGVLGTDIDVYYPKENRNSTKKYCSVAQS